MSGSVRKQVVIVSPALADANNGNWQTARRWQKLLQSAPGADGGGGAVRVRIVRQWPDGPAAAQDTCMLALHARRSADSVAAWALQRAGLTVDAEPVPVPGLAVVLTGTDLYRDIQFDASAQRSLSLAQCLVVLQSLGLQALPAHLQPRTRVIFQSTAARQTPPKSATRLRALMVGHLRDEKSPQTLYAAARLLQPHEGIWIDHVGAPLDEALAAQARQTAAECPHYRWLGGLTHERTRRRIARAHLLVHCSRMEGGAHVVMEAVRSGTPVLASRIAGNVGLLGPDYAGYFDWDDAPQLAHLLRRCQTERDFLAHLQTQCAARAHLFEPAAEQQALLALLGVLIWS